MFRYCFVCYLVSILGCVSPAVNCYYCDITLIYYSIHGVPYIRTLQYILIMKIIIFFFYKYDKVLVWSVHPPNYWWIVCWLFFSEGIHPRGLQKINSNRFPGFWCAKSFHNRYSSWGNRLQLDCGYWIIKWRGKEITAGFLFLDFLYENSLQIYFLDLRKMQTVNCIFDVY